MKQYMRQRYLKEKYCTGKTWGEGLGKCLEQKARG